MRPRARESVRANHRSPRPEVGHLYCGTAGNLWGCSLLVNQPFLSKDSSCNVCMDQLPLEIILNLVLRAVGILLFGVPFQKAFMCPELIAAKDISFPDLCQTTFYLIPALLLCLEGVWLWPRDQTNLQRRDKIGKSQWDAARSAACPMRVGLRIVTESRGKDQNQALRAARIPETDTRVHLHSSSLSITHCTIT